MAEFNVDLAKSVQATPKLKLFLYQSHFNERFKFNSTEVISSLKLSAPVKVFVICLGKSVLKT